MRQDVVNELSARQACRDQPNPAKTKGARAPVTPPSTPHHATAKLPPQKRHVRHRREGKVVGSRITAIGDSPLYAGPDPSPSRWGIAALRCKIATVFCCTRSTFAHGSTARLARGHLTAQAAVLNQSHGPRQETRWARSSAGPIALQSNGGSLPRPGTNCRTRNSSPRWDCQM